MLSFLSRLTGAEGKDAHLKIRMNRDYVFLRGAADEASKQPLEGVLSLRLPSRDPAVGVRLRLDGFLRRRDHDTSSRTIDSSITIRVFEHEWPPFLINHGRTDVHEDGLATTTHEWPFELFIPGDTLETFHGCSRCSIAYQLTATTIRSKTSSATPQTYRTIRINRTLPSSAFELMDPATVEGTWSERLRYSISIGHRAIALGTVIPLEMHFTPLKAGLRISRARCVLLESHKVETGKNQPSDFIGDRDVTEWEMSVKNYENLEQRLYKTSQNLPLPSEPKQCCPDLEAHDISMTHLLSIEITVQESDNSTFAFKYRASLPIILFSSPQMPIDANNKFIRPRSQTINPDLTLFNGLDVPPVYGAHLQDRILSNLKESLPA
ncbi:CreD [Colletotrichum orchidophilum]|uniref:CreD n=1 Tax=Colletotrichum orchidophilum TaxID=1209926 RepID=A0A1G4BRN3_9PEZI|nr:CreD [Colletotrichum orchidophilum]OHF04112.1 CreD [Colletotrichum orchidophilum]